MDVRHTVNLLGGVGQARFQALENELAADMNGVKKTDDFHQAIITDLSWQTNPIPLLVFSVSNGNQGRQTPMLSSRTYLNICISESGADGESMVINL